MSLSDRVKSIRLNESNQMYWSRMVLEGSLNSGTAAAPAKLYEAYEAYYLNNGLYAALQAAFYEHGYWTPAMAPLRNPVNRVVEFYVAKLWPGDLATALPIVTENERILPAIEQVWAWSNWSSRKQLAVRWYAMLGDWFVKIASPADKRQVYLQQIKASYVTDLAHDHRGHLAYIRVDVPQERQVDSGVEAYYLTEVWDKATQTMRRWMSKQGPAASLAQLGTAQETHEFSEYGIDFVPFVHAKFRDIGETRGVPPFMHALDKIDETNRMATRLHQMLFRYNKAVWALSANAMDANGRPLPPPRLGESKDDALEIGDDSIFKLPGMSKLDAMVPDIKYADALAILQAQMAELEADMPEMAYYRIRELGGGLSGRAVRLLLSDAIDRAIEARGNIEAALIQAHEMALTMGQALGLPAFRNIGDYESGDFDHAFRERAVIQISDLEVAETVKIEVGSGVPLVTSLRRNGWSEDELIEMANDQAAERSGQSNDLATALLNAQRNFNQPPAMPVTGNTDSDPEDDNVR